jgi:hypothetical protein
LSAKRRTRTSPITRAQKRQHVPAVGVKLRRLVFDHQVFDVLEHDPAAIGKAQNQGAVLDARIHQSRVEFQDIGGTCVGNDGEGLANPRLENGDPLALADQAPALGRTAAHVRGGPATAPIGAGARSPVIAYPPGYLLCGATRLAVAKPLCSSRQATRDDTGDSGGNPATFGILLPLILFRCKPLRPARRLGPAKAARERATRLFCVKYSTGEYLSPSYPQDSVVGPRFAVAPPAKKLQC